MIFSRPHHHFAAPRGWSNDPNGLFFDGGRYHLYYQYNPAARSRAELDWYRMEWGHAVSPDLHSWTVCPSVLFPKETGARPDCPWSGSAVVDRENCAGFGRGAVLIFFTSTGRGECLAFSNDGGMTFQEYDGNPIVRHSGRDPKVIFDPVRGRWIMTVYDEVNFAAFYSSENLREWCFESRIHGFYECPNLFPMGERWILTAADGRYSVGQFDGKEFIPEQLPKHLFDGDLYAGQLFWGTEMPVMLFWFRLYHTPTEGFLNQMSLPVRLELNDSGTLRVYPAIALPEFEIIHSPDRPIRFGGFLFPPSEELLILEDTCSIEAFRNGGMEYYAREKGPVYSPEMS